MTAQSRELMRLANLTDSRKPLRCLLGLHRFGAFERTLLSSRMACTRCGAVHLSTGFDGVTLNAEQSRAELIGYAKAMEARQGRDGEAGSVADDSASPQGFAQGISEQSS